MMLRLDQLHRDDSSLAAPRYVEGLGNGRYHALPGLSSSMLRDVDVGCVADLWAGRQSMEPPKPTVERGSGVHTLVLEPHTWSSTVHVLPATYEKPLKSGKMKTYDMPQSGDTRNEFVAAALAAGAETVLTSEQAHEALAIAWAVQSHPVARRLLDECPHREPSLTWRHESGHILRVRPDALGSRLVDLKTNAPREGTAHTARSWRGVVLRSGYHLSAAMYRDVVRRVASYDPGPMVWIVASTKRPYTVQVFECGESLEQDGRRRYQAAIERYDRWYAEARQNGAAWAGADVDIETIDIREWT